MRTWKSVLVAIVAMNVESTEAVHALKFFEAVEWHFTRTSDKL